LARFIRELALKDETEIVDLSNVDRQTLEAIAQETSSTHAGAMNGNGAAQVHAASSQPTAKATATSRVGSPISRQLNGRTW
jgi:hypothetical protein